MLKLKHLLVILSLTISSSALSNSQTFKCKNLSTYENAYIFTNACHNLPLLYQILDRQVDIFQEAASHCIEGNQLSYIVSWNQMYFLNNDDLEIIEVTAQTIKITDLTQNITYSCQK